MTEDTTRPKIVITEADIAAAKQGETDLTNVNTTHPFDRREIKELVSREFASLSDNLANATRPKVSRTPDDLESWESARILKRKDRIKNLESDMGYLARVLYEESFSVNQQPGPNPPMKKDMPGVTIGGLITHFYTPEVRFVLMLDLEGNGLRDAVKKLKTEAPQGCEKLIDIVHRLTYPSGSSRFDSRRTDLLIKNPDKTYYPSDFDSIGYRLLLVLQKEPELMEEVKDVELKAKFGIPREKIVNKIQMLNIAWHKSQAMITGSGTFKGDNEPGVKEAVGNLLFFRTHPEMQVFYKYLSPSGYLNENN